MTTLAIHDTHIIYRDSVNLTEECRNCWGCSCHSSETLAQPCNHDLVESVYPQEMVTSIARQAASYGKQMRQLDIAGLKEDLERVAKSWTVYRTQFVGTALMMHARVAYYNAFYAATA